MSISHSLAELLQKHVTLEVESIDRMYLNVYIPKLQHASGASWFLKHERQYPVASSAAMAPISRAFVAAIETYAQAQAVPVLTFEKGQRKDDVVAPYVARAVGQDRIVLIGKAQEKTTTYRTAKGQGPRTRDRYPRLYRSTAMVNHYYFYGVDRDFGPFFFKFSSYFPYTAKFCLNGHEYLKRQLAREGIAYEPLDNGLRTCADPARAQALADGLSAEKIEALIRKWLARLPQPFTDAERAAGYEYEISILQAEFSLTQVLDRPLTGRLFFETAIRENLDLGRPDQVQLIFERRITSRTPSRFRTRIITAGVTPDLACGLQAFAHQTISQRRPGLAHRNHHQRHPRLRHRQTAEEPARLAADRLSSQPTSLARPNAQPRLPLGRRRFSASQPARRRCPVNASPPCASPTRACRLCSVPWSSFGCCRTGSPILSYGRSSRLSWACSQTN